MTAQEVFNKAASHLLQQNERSSVNPGDHSCAYRGPRGLKCAVGVLIPDAVYDVKMEGSLITGLVEGPAFGEVMEGLGLIEHVDLLFSLQCLHDGYAVEEWQEYLDSMAERHGLTKVSLNTATENTAKPQAVTPARETVSVTQ